MKPHVKRVDESQEYFFEEGCFILELSNTPEYPGLSVARVRVKPGRKTRLHRLDGVVERYVVLEGEGRVEVGGLPAQKVRQGDVVIIPPGCPQRIANVGTRDLVFLAICTPRFTRKAYLDIQNGSEPEDG